MISLFKKKTNKLQEYLLRAAIDMEAPKDMVDDSVAAPSDEDSLDINPLTDEDDPFASYERRKAPKKVRSHPPELEQLEQIIKKVISWNFESFNNLKKFQEVTEYFNEPTLSYKSNPLTFWSNETNKYKYPTLYKMALIYLCSPATSAESERVFSKAGLTLTNLRKNLNEKTLEKLLFVHLNFDLLN